MIEQLPGTTIELDVTQWDAADELLGHMFLTGGLMLSQVARLAGVEPYDIQNWVRRGFLPPPAHKLYSRRQLSRIFLINALRATLQIDRICALLGYINGHLDDERDDIIDDSKLYLYFIRLCAAQELGLPLESEALLSDYDEPFPGAKKRVARVLDIMVTAHRATLLRRAAEDMICDLE